MKAPYCCFLVHLAAKMSASSHNPSPVKKARVACRNWPNCAFGDRCKFLHGDSGDAMLAAMRIEMDKQMKAAAVAMAPIKRQQDLCTQIGINFGEFGLAADAMKKNLIGEQLYARIVPALKEGAETMRETGIWHEAITAGKITGMILEAYSIEDALEICANPKRIGEIMVLACERIKQHMEKIEAGRVK